ncbi:FAD assembly factor SdhE [Conchiformibius steedae]|uniref:FAD assembly factor SdhE n=1 Tax=Conchiformibius steedae TaxID=153493 RepID=A0A3P2A4H6_9NEIS|nr:succinate dehydrogenase assembly factor 2 [Conchiformibius steedae]RRD90357.1 succinate dehydrogenase assembly factor 2 family protein [Conchiformibius steedae]
MAQFDDTAKRRIRFLTRRGLLELDILLQRFMQQGFEQLSDAELAVFVEILDLPDQEFLALVNQKQTDCREEFKPLLAKIRNA